jgi:tetratricopeptide (TPR) repeat protein
LLVSILLAAFASGAVCHAADLHSSITNQDAALSTAPSDLERRLFASIHDGRFDGFSLLEAGLIAGGVEREDELHRYCHRFDALVESLRSSGKVRGKPDAQARAIFEFLHRKVLPGGYSLQASDLRQAFDRGRFNCVTATLLYNCMAQQFGLKVVALQLPGHARSRLVLPNGTFDIETTCPQWFDLASDNTRQSGGNAARQLTDVQLIATIYYNRGVDLLAERHFANAAAANAKAMRLDPDNATAKGNYLATINNWGIERAAAGDYPKAAELFRLGQSIDSTYQAFHTNYIRLYRDWSAKLCRDGREKAALAMLEKAAEEQPEEPSFHEAAIEILRHSQEHSYPGL